MNKKLLTNCCSIKGNKKIQGLLLSEYVRGVGGGGDGTLRG